MQRWGSGYVTDIEYSDGFYALQSPAHLALAATLNGVEPPHLGTGFTCCELGCGKGQTALVLAAVCTGCLIYLSRRIRAVEVV